MRGNRPSSLDAALFCPAAPRLSSGVAGRAAFVSTVFHAKAAGDLRWRDLYTQLTDREREDFDQRQTPVDVVFPDGRVLRYSDAHKEVRWGLTDDLRGIDPTGDPPELLTAGTIDCYWDPLDGVVYVADLKGSLYTSHPDSLQLHCYGHMGMALTGAVAYCGGIWACTEGEWRWGSIVDPEDLGYLELRRTLLRAITNTDGPAVTGGHCLGCWSRHHCAEWTLPAASVAGTPLDGLDHPDTITNERALELLLLAERLEELRDKARLILKGWARLNGGIRDAERGKVWQPTPVKGRLSLDRDGLRCEIDRFLDGIEQAGLRGTLEAAGLNPDALRFERHQNMGPPGERYGWVNLARLTSKKGTRK